MLYFSSLQKPHWVLAVNPILFNTRLVAIILCIMRICNHLSFTSLIFCAFKKTVFQEIFDLFFIPFQATIWHTVVVYENVVIEPCTLWCRVDCTRRDLYLICHVISNKYRRRLDILFYWTGATIKSQKINHHAKLCIKFCNSAKPPIFFYKMSDTVHSIVNPLCVFDHLVSHHHILVIENRFRKKLRCRVWFHFTTENYISFEDVWPEGIIFDSLVEKAGAVALIDEEMDTTPSEHLSIYGLLSLTFLSMWVLELEYTL